MKKALLPLFICCVSVINAQNWTYHFSDTTKNKTFVEFDSIADPHHFWNIYSDTATGQYWLGFEADSTAHTDKIFASVVLKFDQAQSVFSTVTIQHSFAFEGNNSGGFVEDNPIFNGGNWSKIIGNGYYFLHDIWINNGPTSDSSDFQNSGSLNSEYRYQCYALKTEGNSDALRFTVYDYDTTPHQTSWKIFGIVAVSHPGICSGIENVAATYKTLSIAPNPTTNSFSLLNNFEDKSKGNYSISIYDFLGRKVYLQEQFITDTQISIAHLLPGIYTVVLRNINEDVNWRGAILKE